ncbi:hypothetical protein [Pedobacter jamesrossensis]|uniref:Periplasmic protein n=1 Tax=Pedobacter jamesrossensis TaxID=1908238 RepID=A0ABV8NMN7_9SPHI
MKKKLFIDSLSIGSLKVNTPNQLHKHSKKGVLPKINVQSLYVKQFWLNNENLQAPIRLIGKNVLARGFKTEHERFKWMYFGGSFRDFQLSKPGLFITSKKIELNLAGNSSVEDISVLQHQNGDSINARIPLISIKSLIKSSDLEDASISNLTIQEPKIYVNKSHDSAKIKLHHNAFNFSHELAVHGVRIANGSFMINNAIKADTFFINSKFDVDVNLVRLKKDGWFELNNTTLAFKDMGLVKRGLFTNAAAVNFKFNDIKFNFKNRQIDVLNGWNVHSSALYLNKDSLSVSATEMLIKGGKADFSHQFGQQFELEKLIRNVSLSSSGIYFKNKTITADIKSAELHPELNKIALKQIQIKPVLSQEQLRVSKPWQSDYIEAKVGSVNFYKIEIAKILSKKNIELPLITIDSFSLFTSRDKRMPERFLIEKLMPSKLLASVKKPFHIGKINLTNGSVDVHEIAFKTGHEGVIELRDINTNLFNLSNSYGNGDSLVLVGKAMLFGKNELQVNYRESYLDSLSSFKMDMQLAPMQLPILNQVSTPLASLKINSGNSDKLIANWIGNKYYATGNLILPYKNLSVALVDNKNPNRKSFGLFLENSILNLFIKHKNNQPASIFFERNRNKFVFNYWIKTALSGFASAVGLNHINAKKNKNRMNIKYQLPAD